MTHRQRVVSASFQSVGAVSVAAPIVLFALGLLGLRAYNGFGLYQILALALGCALVARGSELRTTDAWRYVDSWWNGSRADRRTIVGRYLSIAGQLALLLLLIRAFEIETPVFWSRIAPLALAGCVIHHLTPSRYRLAMFLFLSLAAIWLVFSVSDSLWLVGVGVALVALCHLPLPFWTRVGLVAVAGVALATGRIDWIPVPWSKAIWPILGSIFMFRMIVYLYDLRHDKVPGTWPQRLAYFFLLPNVVFPLFPIVDYGMFRRTYYDAEAYRIYQRGVEWILRGVVHLILYRFMYERWSITPSEVTSAAGIAQYMVVSFLLYVRVSGQFHLIVGMLHLFGFHLPPTHRQYFFAASFSDLWRRINIYWKDFMMKLFYYPVFFRVRRYGERRAIILATFVVFLVTWVLHSYQWFWLLGSFPLTVTDGLFWTALAALLIASSLYEARHGRVRALAARAWTPRELGVHSLKVAGTFATIAFLWSLWMSPSFTDWLSLWSVERIVDARVFDGPPLWLVGTMVTGVAVLPRTRWVMSFTRPDGDVAFGRSVALSTIAMVAMLVVSRPAVTSRLGAEVGGTIASLRSAQLNRQDLTRLTRGYYEELMGVARLNSRLWEVYMQQPPGEAWPMLSQTAAMRKRGDFLQSELVPNTQINFLGAVLTVNRWGMRDRDYERAKPPGVWRIAVVGTSVDMGWGVGDDDSYEQTLERRLNEETGDGSRIKYEVLNFSVAGHTAAAHLLDLDRVLSFAPDVVLIPAREEDPTRLVERVVAAASRGAHIPIDTLRKAARAASVAQSSEAMIRKRLEPHGYDLLQGVYQEMGRRIRVGGAIPLWVFVPMPDGKYEPAAITRFSERAAKSGFEVLDMSDAFRGHDVSKIRVATFDRHPNRDGHSILADRLYRALRGHAGLLGAVAD